MSFRKFLRLDSSLFFSFFRLKILDDGRFLDRRSVVAALEVLQLLVLPVPQVRLLLLQLKCYLFYFFFSTRPAAAFPLAL